MKIREKVRRWLIKKVVGNRPVIMNVTLTIDEPIKASEPDVLFDKCNVTYSEKLQKEMA